MQMKTSFRISMLASVCSLAFAAPALAQSGQAAVDDAADAEEIIIVTASLREANVQDIPIAVTAFAPSTLERQGVVDVKLLNTVSPSFSYQSTSTETSGSAIRIRGVGTTGNNPGLESSVGIFIDGVYQSRPGVAFGELVDIERLEVLRGPQGTLFGRNTSAGALNIITKKPSLTKFEGFANATYGNYDLLNLQAGVGGPISESVGFRLSGSWRQRDGVAKSATGATSNNKDRWLLRGQLYFEPSQDLSIRILADYSKIDEKCCDAVIIADTTLATQANATFHGLPNTGVANVGPTALDNLLTNGKQSYNGADNWGISGELKYDLGPAKITYIGAYRDFDSFQTTEVDLTGLNILTQGAGGVSRTPGQPKMGDRIKTLTQELRLQGEGFDGRLDWLVGAFYGDEKLTSVATATLGADYQRAAAAFQIGTAAGPNPLFTLTAFGNGGIPVSATGAHAANQFTQIGKTYSIFTHNVFNLTDALSLTFGARYVDERKEAAFKQLQANNPACQASVNGALTGAVPAAFRNTLVALNCGRAYPVNTLAPAAVGGGLASNFLNQPREFAGVFKDDALTYTAQLAYKPSSSTLLYGSFSHGFKSGGFNLDQSSAVLINSAAVLAGLAAGTPVAPQFADPRLRSEKVDAYELGLKATLGRMNVNIAMFHMDMTDFQLLEFDGLRFRTFNVPSVKSTGVEVEVFGKLNDHVSINLAGTYANTRFPDDCATGLSAAEFPTVSTLCGSTLPRSPKFSGAAGITYDGPLGGSGWGLLTNVNLQYSDSYRSTVQPRDTDAARTPFPFGIQDNFVKVNARIGLTTPDERFTVEVWGLNLTNKVTQTLTGNVPLRGVPGNRARAAFFEEPRTYGVTVRTKF
jgi:iron complex outermembrane receptor protein